MPSIHQVLFQYWGYRSFRPMQEEIIHSVLEGKDLLAIMPTGGGKSLCYQVPSLCKEGICLVVSPLIALMRDQVERLNSLGIPALSIFSGMRYIEVRKTLQNAAYGNFKFLYVSPERLESNLFLEWLPALPLNLIAVDEAHCIAQWGYDFRPSYLNIAKIRETHPRVSVLALTASATPAIQEDICEKLRLNQPARFIQSFARPNLSYSVFNVDSKINKLVQVLRKVPGSSIVYCKSRKRTAEISEMLNGYGIKASYYHAGLSAEERTDRQEKWQKNESPVMVCTNAFGMGIDKPDVRTVVHMDIPDCLESYYQESGRAGRDGKKAYAVLLYAGRDLEDLENQSSVRFPEISTIRKIYQALVNFFQLPAGAGEDQYFDFDLKEFCQRFKLDTQQVVYSIKALEQEDLISYAEQIFLPATVQFRVSGEQIFEWEKQSPQTEPLIKILLRTYGGIMDQPTPISEKQIAGGLRTSLDMVKSQLVILHQSGLLTYQPQKERPQIQFIHGRPRAEDIGIHSGNYRKRKKAYESRLRTMLDFAKDRGKCRQKIIAAYFTGENLPPCGICDNCIDSKKNPLTESEFTQIVERIFDAITTRPLDITELLPLLPDIRKEKTWAVIDLLVVENKVVVDTEGRISPKNKKGPG